MFFFFFTILQSITPKCFVHKGCTEETIEKITEFTNCKLGVYI